MDEGTNRVYRFASIAQVFPSPRRRHSPPPAADRKAPGRWGLLGTVAVSGWGPQFAQAAATKYHRLRGFDKIQLFPHGSGGWKAKIKVLAGLVFPKDSWLAEGRLLTVSSHNHPPVCAHPWVSVCIQISSSLRTPVRLD